MSPTARFPVASVREEAVEVGVPLFVNEDWVERFPWLFHGVTGGAFGGEAFDLALFGGREPAGAMERWTRVGEAAGFPRLVHSPQVHGGTVRLHREGPPGFLVCPPGDGHASRAPGVLMAITIADCVPVFVVDPIRRALALLHAGWRGTSSGILERGLEVLRDRLASRTSDLHVHLGPAICGSCYEVGAEVFEALGIAASGEKGDLDLRAELAARAVAAGVGEERLSVSEHCTRCEGSPFFSCRAGDSGRQAALLGVRP